jgi:hypothetical protein
MSEIASLLPVCCIVNFCLGISVPLLKDNTENVNDVNTYRGIASTPLLSKLIEGVILQLCLGFGR